MSQTIRGRGGHLIFQIGPKNTNLVEDVEILLPVKFRWIPFSGSRGEVENASANHRPGRPSCYSNRPGKHKLGTVRWDLTSYQVAFGSGALKIQQQFYARVLKGPPGHLVIGSSVCLSVRNSVPITNKVQYLKFGWWYSNQTWTVSSSMVSSHFTDITCPWGGAGSICRT